MPSGPKIPPRSKLARATTLLADLATPPAATLSLLLAATLPLILNAAVTEGVDRYTFSGAGHAIEVSKTDGSILSAKVAGSEIATGGNTGLWSLTYYDGASHDGRGNPDSTTTLTAAALLAGTGTFTPTLVNATTLEMEYADATVGLTLTVTMTDRADGIDLSAEIAVGAGAGFTVLQIDLPAEMRFAPGDLNQFIAPNHSSDGVGMAFNPNFFQVQTEDNPATWEKDNFVGATGYTTLFGSGLVFETSDEVALSFTTDGTTWLGSAVESAWNGTDAVVNRPPDTGQWDLLLIDSPKGPFFSGSKLGGTGGYLMRIGGNVNGQTAVDRSLDVVSAAIDHLAQSPGGRSKVAVLYMERGPVIGESWPSEVRIDEWFDRLEAELNGTGIEVVYIEDYSEMTTALASPDYIAILNPYGENIPVSLSGGVVPAVNAIKNYVHAGGNWFEVGGHPFFFELQPDLYYEIDIPYPPAFADFFQLETVNGNASLFGVQPVLANPSNPWSTTNLFVPGNLTWGADATGGFFERSFVTHVQPTETWTTPDVRLAFGYNAEQALDEYASANAITRDLEDKIPSAATRTAFKESLLLRVLGTATELTSRIPEFPSPSVIHFTQYLKGGFDKEYPDHLPVAASFGTEAEFQTFLSSANAAGLLTMPYTNPTFWGVGPKGPTWTAIGNDDPLLLNLDGSINYEEYFGHGGFTATPWHPEVRASNEKTIDLFNGDPENHYPTETSYQVDFFFQDQVGARTWDYDANTASPEEWAYMHGIIALNAEDSTKLPVSTENGFDRIINFQSQFCGLAWGLAPTPGAPFWRRYLSDRYDPATWTVFPLAQHLAHDKLGFTYNNLGASTATDETIAWALGLGYGMTYFFDESDLDDTAFQGWLAWLARVQKSVAGRYIGEGVSAFTHTWGADLITPDNGTITATYGPVDLVANLSPTSEINGSRTLAAHGFVATAPGMLAARMIEPGGSDPVNFVAETDSYGGADFWIYSVGGQDVTIELPPGMNGTYFVSVEGGAAVQSTVSNDELTVTLPVGAVPSEATLWHGTVSHFDYTVNPAPADNLTLNGYIGPNAMVIPETIGGRPVVEIGVNAFQNQTSLTSVAIPDTVTTIGDYGFAGCTGLTDITVPDSVTLIGAHAFDACTGLSSIDLGLGLTSLGFAAFQGCTSLTTATIPDSVTSLGGNAFFNCTSLTSVTIGSGITSIGTAAFQNSGLTSITIPDTVTEIGNFAFFACTGLTDLTIGSGVTTIGQGAFQDCDALTHVSLPASVTSIGNFAFSFNDNLEGIYFLGDAPTADTSSFTGGFGGKSIFYGRGSSGWTDPWQGIDTFDWTPTADSIVMQVGGLDLTLSGPEGALIQVEKKDTLTDTNWDPIGTTKIQSGTAGFTDPSAAGKAQGFYRFTMP